MKTMRLTKKSTRNALVAALMTASLLLALSIGGVVTSAQSGFEGDYDLSFGTNGYTVDQEDVDPSVNDEYQSLFYTGELLPDGSIIAGGRYVDNAPRGDFYLKKFTASGAVDTSFGANGMVRTNFHYRHDDGVGGNDTPQVLKVQPDGKIVFAGQCTALEPGPWPAAPFGTDACVMRYNANGTLDQTFGGGTLFYDYGGSTIHTTQLDPGKVIFQTGVIADGHSFGTGGTYYDMAIQPDGKIVLVGETRNNASFYVTQGFGAIVVRLNPNGSLDTTFGSGGIARWTAPEGPTTCFPPRRFSGVRLQPDGRIIAVGYDSVSTCSGSLATGNRFVVTRWTAAGQLETVRHLDNHATFNFQDELAVSAHLTLDGSKVLVSGSHRNLSGTPAGRQKPTLVRLHLSNLSLDTTFGNGGIVQYDRVSDNRGFSTLYVQAIQPDGKILGTDNTLTGSTDNVVRFNPDGSLDQSFGNLDINGSPGHGRARVNVTHYNSITSALELGQILVRPNGRINLVGYSAAFGGFGILRAVVSQQNTELPSYTIAGRVFNSAGTAVAGVTVNLTGAQSAAQATDASGNYSFEGLTKGGNFTVTPTKAGLSFAPASKSLTNLSADQLSVNFAVPSLSVNNVAVTEGNTGATTATFTVKLTPAATVPVTVKYATANSTALAPGDYTALALTQLTFAPGETSKTVVVQVKGDTLDEPNETFRLLLSAPTNAVITDSEGVCTITDNDAPPAVRVNNVSVTEGNSATTASFSITLSTPSAQTVTVKYQTINKTAVAGRDYTAKPLTTLTFSPFQTTKTVPVSITGDLLDEPAETFNFVLSSPTNATIGVPQATATITDNDSPPSITITNVTVTEPDAGTRSAIFTIKLTPASGQTVTVKYATANGTATAGTDYTALALATLTFAPGETTKTVTVPVKGDTAKEASETFFVNLSAPVNATIADAQGSATITNDD